MKPHGPFLARMSMVPRPLGLLIGGVAVAGAYAYGMDARSAIHQYVICPVVRAATPDAELGHAFGVWAFKWGLCPRVPQRALDKDTDVLKVSIFGQSLDLPIGMAAGFDKNGDCIDALFRLGFSYVEIGSVTPEPQPGNPKPRFFRLPRDDAVINRYGFNSVGHFAVLSTLKQRFARLIGKSLPNTQNNSFRENNMLAINIGKNKTGDEINDYVLGVRRFAPFADVLVVNVSLPNTPGLRDLQSEKRLTAVLEAVVKERDASGPNDFGRAVPVLVKIAPDLTEPEVEAIALAATTAKVQGVIVSNTTIERPQNLLTTNTDLVLQAGGLSGPPLKPYALRTLRALRKHTKGSDLILVGCGGISNADDALEFGRAGASFVQLYTSFAYAGPGLPSQIRSDLATKLRQQGKTWEQIVGTEIETETKTETKTE